VTFTAPEHVLAQYLVDLGLASWVDENPAPPAWAVSVGMLPPEPGNAIAVVAGPASSSWPRNMRDGGRDALPSVAVSWRAVDYDTGRRMGVALEAALDAIGLFGGVGVGRYKPPVRVYADGPVYAIAAARVTVTTTKIGTEEKARRPLFSMTVRLTLEGPF
jgi:hypothetical protein